MLTPEELQAWWRDLNVRYFADELPPILIIWSQRLTSSAGLFLHTVGPRAPMIPSATCALRRLIRLSIPLLSNQRAAEVRSTLAHEMIHQWQYDVRQRRPDHGDDFRRVMATMNGAGLGVTIRHSLTDNVAALNRYAWHCVGCGRVYHRHRRTIQPARHRCGTCAGSLQELPRRDQP